MIKKLENYQFELEKILKSLAKQDFDTAVDILEKLINDINRILKNKEFVKQGMIKMKDLKEIYGINSFPENFRFSLLNAEYLLTKVFDISDIENIKVKNTYFRNGGTVYLYDKESKKWIVDSTAD